MCFSPLNFLGVKGKKTWFPWGQRQRRNHLSEQTMEKRSAYYHSKRKSLPASENQPHNSAKNACFQENKNMALSEIKNILHYTLNPSVFRNSLGVQKSKDMFKIFIIFCEILFTSSKPWKRRVLAKYQNYFNCEIHLTVNPLHPLLESPTNNTIISPSSQPPIWLVSFLILYPEQGWQTFSIKSEMSR